MADQAHAHDTGTDGEHRLLAAVRRDDVQAVAALLPEKLRQSGGGNAPLPTADGRSVLHLAPSPAMVDALFTHGGPAVQALLNAGCGSRFPWKVPLCTAKNAPVASKLLERGACPDGAERRYERQAPHGGGPARLTHLGNTPLHEAAARLDPETVKVLLDAGAAPTLVNSFGTSAADRAFASRYFSEARAAGEDVAGPSGVGAGAGAAGGAGAAAAREGDEEQDEDDNDSDDAEPSSLPPEEARARFSRVLLLLLRAGGKMKAGYLHEALPLVAGALAEQERAAERELERRRTDPRLAALAREDLAGLALDFKELREAEAAAEAARVRLERMEAEVAAVDDDEEEATMGE